METKQRKRRVRKRPDYCMHDVLNARKKVMAQIKLLGDETKTYKTVWKQPKDREMVEQLDFRIRRINPEDTQISWKYAGGPRAGYRRTVYWGSINYGLTQYRFADLAPYFTPYLPGLTKAEMIRIYKAFHEKMSNRTKMQTWRPPITELAPELQKAIGSMTRNLYKLKQHICDKRAHHDENGRCDYSYYGELPSYNAHAKSLLGKQIMKMYDSKPKDKYGYYRSNEKETLGEVMAQAKHLLAIQLTDDRIEKAEAGLSRIIGDDEYHNCFLS